MKTILCALAAATALSLTATPAQAGDQHRQFNTTYYNNYNGNRHGWNYYQTYREPRRIYYSGAPARAVVVTQPVEVRHHRVFWLW